MMKIKLAALLCLGALTVLGETTEPTSNEQPKPQTAVVLKLDGPIREAPPEIDLGISDLQSDLFWDDLQLIRRAAKDESVRAIILLINQPELKMAQVQQLAAEIKRFKAAGKNVFVHADTLESGPYLLALSADQIAMTPSSILMLAGVRMQVLYFKELMTKLGIEVETVHAGKYKLAAEPYTRDQPSEEMAEQLNDLVNDIYGQIAGEISQSRNLAAEKTDEIIDNGPYTAEQALDAKLIDRVCHRDKFLREIKETSGLELVFDYSRSKVPSIQPGLAGFFQMLRLFGGEVQPVTGDKIAVVVVNGVIVEGSSEEFWDTAGTAGSETLRKAFKSINRDDGIKGVVVRIDSPGGSATASEIIWNVIKETAERKPVVISMSGEAASGGYYIACAGEYIFAAPSTITGSIGVIAGKPVVTELLSKIGVSAFSVAKGKNAGILDPVSKSSDHQRETLQKLTEQVYRQFALRVEQGRAGKIKDISELATGRVFTGREAVKLGLVDEIGTLADAVDRVAKDAGTESYHVIMLPKPKTLPEIILESLGYNVDPESVVTSRQLLSRVVLGGPVAPFGLSDLPGTMGLSIWSEARMIVRVLQGGQPLMLAPVHIDIR